MEQEQILSVFDSLPVGVGLYSNDGTLIHFNENFCRIFGIDEASVKEKPININDNVIIPGEMKTAVCKGHNLHTSITYNFDASTKGGRYISSHSQDRVLKFSGNQLLNSTGKEVNYILIVEDVTEPLRKEEMLRRSKRKTELAIQAADIVLWEYDALARYFYSDNEPLIDYDESKPISCELYIETLHSEDREHATEMIRRMNEGEDFTFSFETRIILPDSSDWQYCTVSGSPYEYDQNGKVIKYVGSRKNNTEINKKQVLLKKVLDNIPLSVHIKDIEDRFRYVFCNEESKRMFGTSEDKTTYDVLSNDEVARIQKTDIEVFNTGTPYLGLEHIVLKDGRSYDTIVRKSIIEDEGKRLLLNTRWDQSMQNELKRRAQLLSITLETMNAYTWFYEPDIDRLSFGEGFDKTGIKNSDFDTKEKYLKLVHPDDKKVFTESLQEALDSENDIWDVEVRLDFKGNGEYQWWEVRGIVETTTLNDEPYKYMFGMSLNIDSHKHTEMVLLENKKALDNLVQQNELVLNNTNSGLAYITKDYIVQWENISFCSKSISYEAYKKGELCYKSAHNRTSPCENCVLQRALLSHQTEQIKFNLDSEHTVEVFATPVFMEDGTMDGIVIRVDDVTERERMIEELRQAKLEAEQSDKLKSAFLANMSHEIRTPLNAIVGFSELMMYGEEEDREEYIQIINTNNELLLKLINDILDLSKLEAGSVELKYEKYDLSEHFNNMTASMKQRITNPNVCLLAVNPYSTCQVLLDRNRVAQVLTNYVTNAIKYTPTGTIEMGYEKREQGIYFYVKDTGIGIADEKKEKVFHRFEKLDDFAQGTGLGLSICKAIAESMGGTVGFESNYGEGSLFWAMLPCEVNILSEEADSAKAADSNGRSSTSASGLSASDSSSDSTTHKTILIAEDIQSNYQLVSAMLKKNYELLRAVNGKEVLDIVRNRHIDLLLTDMKMPVMDGLSATAEIRKFNTKLPIIALTAHAFETDRLAALAAGCNEYLVKPIDKAKLMAVLKKYC
ncbi:response regulator [Bacteroides sp.]|uniref:response regulator n=1 Tax=Bacteroides sp. TaxID=29523 RepID=UPI00260B8B7F|nr:response regulator [Bacteroides sp.]